MGRLSADQYEQFNNITSSAPGGGDDSTQGYELGDEWLDTSTKKVWKLVAEPSPGNAEWKDITEVAGGGGGSQSFQMALGGQLDCPTLPLSRVGIERASAAVTLTRFSARRGVPGTSGTTTIQLEVDGAAVSGATLSWVPADAAFTEKVIGVSQAIVLGNDVSFRLTAAEVGAEDIYAEASA